MTSAKMNFAVIAVMCVWGVQAMAADGLITLRSSYAPLPAPPLVFRPARIVFRVPS